MIAFATLWLGIVSGTLPVSLLVGSEVARVELRLDGVPVATLTAPPWELPCELGPEIAPHELLAVAFDATGRPLGEARQLLNLPRPAAELEVALTEDDIGAAVHLGWGAIGGVDPAAVRAWLDGEPLPPPTDPRLLRLPAIDPERPHLLRLEADFPGLTATHELVLGGALAEQATIGLTAVPIELARRRTATPETVPLHVAGRPVVPVALEKGLADLVAVVDPGARDALARLADRAGRRRIAHGGGPGLRDPARAPNVQSSTRELAPLDQDERLRLVLPTAERSGGDELRFELFPTSPELTSAQGGLLRFLALGGGAGAGGEGAARLADAVAVAALVAGQHGRRRAVLLVVDGDGTDQSQYPAAVVRRFLTRLRVPLRVWSTGEPAAGLLDAWGPVQTVDSLARLERAARELGDLVERQRMAWVAGSYLPQQLALGPDAGELRLAGDSGGGPAGAPAPPGTGAAGEEAADPHGAAGEQLGQPAGTPSLPPRVAAPRAPEPTAAPAVTNGDLGAHPGALPDLPAGFARHPLGPFTLATDVSDRQLLARLTAVAGGLAASYRQRFGLEPTAAGQLLLFAREQGFRHWLAAEQGPRDGGVEGFAIAGTAAVYTDGRPRDEVLALAVHELGHLLTRSATGRPLAPWLEEGLAEDLAMSRLDGDGRLVLASLRTERTVRGIGASPGGRATRVERIVRGPGAALVRLVGTPGAQVPLATLLTLDSEAFVQPVGRAERYATAGFLVRYLLAEPRSERFRAFLAAVAAGGDADPPALLAALGEPLDELERGFTGWLRRTALAGGG